MAMKISVKKGSGVALNVVASYLVAAAALWANNNFGVPVSEAVQTELTVVLTAAISGLIHGALNWWKHRKVLPVTTTPAP